MLVLAPQPGRRIYPGRCAKCRGKGRVPQPELFGGPCAFPRLFLARSFSPRRAAQDAADGGRSRTASTCTAPAPDRPARVAPVGLERGMMKGEVVEIKCDACNGTGSLPASQPERASAAL